MVGYIHLDWLAHRLESPVVLFKKHISEAFPLILSQYHKQKHILMLIQVRLGKIISALQVY